MVKFPVLAGGATALVLAAGASAAVAAAPVPGGASMSLNITARVPVICRAQVIGAPVLAGNGTVQLGSLKEFCNNASGYRVVASYSPALAKAKLVLGGKTVPLGASGSTVISQSNKAGISARDLALELPRDAAPDSFISFRIEPL